MPKALILDFQERAFNSQRDLILFIRECVDGADPNTAKAFTRAYREVDPENADNTLAICAGWAFRDNPDRVRIAMSVFGLESTLFGPTPPVEKTRPVWEPAAKLQDQIAKGIKDANEHARKQAEAQAESEKARKPEPVIPLKPDPVVPDKPGGKK